MKLLLNLNTILTYVVNISQKGRKNNFILTEKYKCQRRPLYTIKAITDIPTVATLFKFI